MVQIQAIDIDFTKVYVHTDNNDDEVEAFYDNIEFTLKYTKPREITMLISTQKLEIRKMNDEIDKRNCVTTNKLS